jgi:hypothetical protein
MALKHIIKHTETEIVFKCYATAGGGTNIDLSLQNDMTKSTQVYVAPGTVPNESTEGSYVDAYNGSHVFITGIWWGCAVNKKLDITRIITASPYVEHGHYYLINTGFYDFTTSGGGFSDRVYANKDIRLAFDGPGHCIIRLRKAGWLPKVETATFSIYDDVNAVGS